MVSGCQFIPPPNAALSLMSVTGPTDSFSLLHLPYPAGKGKRAEPYQISVGDYLRSALAKNLPGAEITVRKWEPQAEVKGIFGPHVSMSLGFEFDVRQQQSHHIVSDHVSADLGHMYVIDFTRMGLPAIRKGLRAFLDTVVEKVALRLREADLPKAEQA
jgi:hypothetical protein